MKIIKYITAALTVFAVQFSSIAASGGKTLQFSSPEQLRSISGTATYSIAQDSQGAIWLNTGFGLCRFNGQEVTIKTKPLTMHHLCQSPDGQDIYAISSDALYRFNISKSEPFIYGSRGRDLSNCALLWFQDSPIIGVGNEICIQDADSLKTLVTCNIQGSFNAGIRTSDDGILLSTNKFELLKLTEDLQVSSLKKIETAISTYYRSKDGRLWAGTTTRGLAELDENKLQLNYINAGTCISQSEINQIRTIAEGVDGQIYFGSATGLYCQKELNRNGQIQFVTEEIKLSEGTSVPVCSVFKSRNNSLWIGTFYNGVLCNSAESIPFQSIRFGDGNAPRLIKAMIPSGDGQSSLLFTDGNGVYMLNTIAGTTQLIPDLPKLKYQSACENENEIIAVDYTPEIIIFSKKDLSYRRINISEWDAKSFDGKINSISIYNGKLYAGGDKGLYIIDLVEKRISSVGPSDKRILNLKVSEKGTLLAAGDGLYEWDGQNITCRRNELYYTDAAYGSDGTLWAANAGLGLLRVYSTGEARFYNKNSDGLGSDFLSAVIQVSDQTLALGTRSGISLLDCQSGIVRNYSSINGLSLGSNLARSAAKTEGKIIFGGTAGPAVLDIPSINAYDALPMVYLEKITVDGEEMVFPEPLDCVDNITLESGQDNFNLAVTTFEYPEITAGIFSYRLEGLETEWTTLNLNEKIIYRNLRPGRYRLTVRSMAGQNIFEKSIGIRIKPAWWQKWWVITLFVAIILIVITVILKTTYSKMLLAQKLRNREQENEERTRYFVRISRSLRNPLSLIIGQLEIFLRSNSPNTGRNQIESAFKNAEQLQRIISDYESFENQAADAEAATYEQPQKVNITEARFHEYRMLIADENDEIREMLRTIFSSRYDIIEEKDGEDAWNTALREIPDIIISDVKLPRLSGTELCQRLRQNFETSHIVIILLTAHASEQAGLIGMTSGADDYITKPFNIKILEARCGNLLKSRRLLMEKYSLVRVEKRKDSVSSPEAKFLNAAIGVIERNISNPDFNVGRLCEELCTSKTGLTNKLKKAVEMSPRDFIEDLRLRKAAQSLLDGGKSIAEIADEFCFCSAKYFSTRFHNKFGVIPSRYVASIREGSEK